MAKRCAVQDAKNDKKITYFYTIKTHYLPKKTVIYEKKRKTRSIETRDASD